MSPKVTGLPLLSAFSSIHDALHSTAFTIAVDVVLSLAVLFWLGIAFWVFRDARRRMGHPVFVGVATTVGLVPLVGPPVYLLLRPSETLDDLRARDLELHALEQELTRRQAACPVCSSAVEPDYLVCPVCRTRLRQACSTCEAPLEPLWQLCPYCASAIEPLQEDLDAALTGELQDVLPDGLSPLMPLHEARVADG